MTEKAELIYKPDFHVCASELWKYEKSFTASNLVVGMVVACSCGDYYQLREKPLLFGKWTISWHMHRLYWVRINKKSWISRNTSKN